jgi:hypothetical protein
MQWRTMNESDIENYAKSLLARVGTAAILTRIYRRRRMAASSKHVPPQRYDVV